MANEVLKEHLMCACLFLCELYNLLINFVDGAILIRRGILGLNEDSVEVFPRIFR